MSANANKYCTSTRHVRQVANSHVGGANSTTWRDSDQPPSSVANNWWLRVNKL